MPLGVLSNNIYSALTKLKIDRLMRFMKGENVLY